MIATSSKVKWRKQKLPFAEADTIVDYVHQHGTDEGFKPREAPRATQSMPGTEEKIEVLRHRAEKGYGIFHRSDHTIEDEIQRLAEIAGLLPTGEGDE